MAQAAGPKPIVIEKFQTGIADSPHDGFGDMRCVDIYSQPGTASVNFAMENFASPAISSPVTVFLGLSQFTLLSANLGYGVNSFSGTGRAVTLVSTGSLPGGITAGTVYFVISRSSTVFVLASTLDNALGNVADISLSSVGSGTITVTSVDPAQLRWMVKDTRSSYRYGIDLNGRVWEQVTPQSAWNLITGNTIDATGTGNGIAIYHNYLFVFRQRSVDVWGSLTTSTRSARTWTNNWQVMNDTSGGSGLLHPSLVGQDDTLYWGDQNTTTGASSIGSLMTEPNMTFNPATSSTYDFNTVAQQLPTYKTVTCLAELGVNLMIGTNAREIYPWDRTDPSYNIPIIAAERNISKMVVLNNVLYFAAGYRGQIYATIGGYQTQPVKILPYYLTNLPKNSAGTALTLSISDMVPHKGRLFLAVQCIGCSGIWSLNVTTGTLVLEHQVSAGGYDDGYNPYQISALFEDADAETLHCSWRSIVGGTAGIDNTSNYHFYSGYTAYVESPLYQIANPDEKRALENCQVELTQPLTSGQGIQLQARTSLSGSYAVIDTHDFTTYNAIQNASFHVPIETADYVQVRAYLESGTTSSTAPRLKSITLS